MGRGRSKSRGVERENPRASLRSYLRRKGGMFTGELGGEHDYADLLRRSIFFPAKSSLAAKRYSKVVSGAGQPAKDGRISSRVRFSRG